jgi:hypothetical protein
MIPIHTAATPFNSLLESQTIVARELHLVVTRGI